MCLVHYPGGSNNSGIEHERRRVCEGELRMEDIEGQIDLISRLHWSGVKTKEIHEALHTPGKRLGEQGKQKVSGRVLNMARTRRTISYV